MPSRFKSLFLSVLISGFCACVQAQGITVVKTRSLPTVERLLAGFQAACEDEYKINVYDMEGSSRQGQKILTEIKNSHSSGRPQTILTLGLPATRLIQGSSINSHQIFAMINDPYGRHGIKKTIPGFTQSLSADKLLEQVKVVLPGVEKVAIIYSNEVSKAKINEFIDAAGGLSLALNSYFIHSLKDLPGSLLRVVRENDVLLLIPDKNVTNRHSVEFLVTTAITRAFPIIGYNEHLVKTGLMASISPDYLALGEMAGRMICSKQGLENATYPPRQAILAVNVQALKIIKPNLFIQLQEIADYVY